MSLEAVSEDAKVDKWFQTNHLQGDLKGHSVKGGVSTMASQIFSFLMTTGQTFIMARLLMPEDYGLIAMVSSIIGFITLFKDFGLTSAVIQKEKLTQTEVSSVFWVNVLLSLGIALIIALLAPAIAYFYEEERLLGITLVFALNIFIIGLSLQHNALMKRQMLFNSLAYIHLATVALNLLVGIVLAYLGFGYWALVMQATVLSVTQTVALWLLCDWRPDFIFKKSTVGYYMKFGAGITGFDFVNHFSRNMDNVLIGKFVGAVAAGLYSKAYQLLMLPITQLRNPLSSVALPALSSLQNDPYKFRSFYARYIFILAFFSMPIVVYLGVFANELVPLVLGDQWTEAALLFQILALAGFIQPVASSTGIVLITTGKVKKYFYLGLINSVFTVIGFAIGVLWGAEGVAISYAIVTYSLFLPLLVYTFKDTPVPASDFLRQISLPMLFSLLSGGAMVYFRYYMAQHSIDVHTIVLCAAGFVVGAILYFVLWFVTPATKAKLMEIIQLGINLVGKRFGKKTS